MDKMLVAAFDSETKAYEGSRILRELDAQGGLTLYAIAMIANWSEGRKRVAGARPRNNNQQKLLIRAQYFGQAVKMDKQGRVLIPVAVALAPGVTPDLNNARIGDAFIDDVTKVLLHGRVAVVAEVDEELTTPVDIRMQTIGGTVFRRALTDVKDTGHDEDVEAMKADIAQMKAEHAKAQVDRKAGLQEKVKQLYSKLLAQLQKAKDRRQAQAQVEVQILKAKAAAARANW